jgi:hypothetical protein
MRVISLILILIFLTFHFCYAGTVINLKSGETVEGTLLERNDQWVKINFSDVELTYWLEDIDSIILEDGTKIVPEKKSKPAAEARVEENIVVSEEAGRDTGPLETASADEKNFSSDRQEVKTLDPSNVVNKTRQMSPAYTQAKALRLSDKNAKTALLFGAGLFGGFALMMLVLAVATYVLAAFCLQTIANKTGTAHGWYAWIPVMNLILLCDIAGKPRWWVLLFLLSVIPIIGALAVLVISVILMMAVCEKRGKAKWLGILAVLPLVNLFVLAYLAFSE